MTNPPDDVGAEPAAQQPVAAALLPTDSVHRGDVLINATIGGGSMLVAGVLDVATATGRLVAPMAHFLLAPPLVPEALAPMRAVEHLAARGKRVSQALSGEADVVTRRFLPALTDEVVQRMDLTEVVLRRVDLGRIVMAVLDRIDLTELVLQRVDLDRVIAAADLDAAAAKLDVDAVATRLDVNAVLDRMDLTEVVLRRVDLGRIVVAVLDRIDLTELVLQRVDLDRVIAAADLDAAAARLDVDAVAARLDLVGVAEYIIDAVDLPEIIRTSTGSVATEAVRGARMQSIDADAQLQRAVDRVLLRRRARRTDAPGDIGEDLRDEASSGEQGSGGGGA